MSGIPERPTPPPRRPERGRLDLLLVAVVAAAVHLPSLGNGFVLDDHFLIEGSETIRRPFDLGAIWGGRFFTESSVLAPYYRPLVVQSFALNYWAGGLQPFGYHLVNVLLHAAAALLLLVVGRAILPGVWPARLAAVLFAVHPLASEPVDAVYGRTDLLAAVFALAAAAVHLRGGAAPRRLARASVGAGLYLLALLAKESAAPLLGALVVIDAALAARGPRGWREAPGAWRRRAIDYLLLGGALAVYLGMRAAALGGLLAGEAVTFLHNPLVQDGAAVRLLTAPVLLVNYLRIWLLPWGLSPDYSFNALPVVTAVSDPRFLVGAPLAAGFLAAGIWLARRRHPAFSGWAGFLSFYALVANLAFPVGAILAERFLYLPMAGLCLAVGGAAAAARGGVPARLALGTVLALLAALSWQRAATWRSDETVARATIAARPGSAVGYHQLGTALMHSDPPTPEGLDQALAAFGRALAIYPDYSGALFNAGIVLLEQGRAAEAVPLLERAQQLVPDGFGIGYALGRAYLGVGRAEDALDPLARAVRTWPEEGPFQVAYAAALEASGRDAEARSVLLPLVAAGERSSDVLFTLALIEIRLGEFEAAAPRLRAVLERDPADVGARVLLGRALEGVGEGREAEASYRSAIEADPAHAEAWYRLGLLQRRRGDPAGGAALATAASLGHPLHDGESLPEDLPPAP